MGAPWSYDLAAWSVVPGVRADVPLDRPNSFLYFDLGIGFLYAVETSDTSPFADELPAFGNFALRAGAGFDVGLRTWIAVGPYASIDVPIGKSAGPMVVAGLRLTLSGPSN